VKSEKKLASQEVTLVAIERSSHVLSENQINALKNQTVRPGDAFECTAFIIKPGFAIVKF
jgi:hypothetical protein